MKKIVLVLAILGFTSAAMAQEPKSILLYGDLNLSDFVNSSLQKTDVWDATIGFGYQFNQNWTLGVNISWGQNAFKDSSTLNGNPLRNTENSYLFGPFLRYSHYLDRSEIFFWYSQFELNYEGGYHTNSDGVPAYNKHDGYYVGVTPALGINLHKGYCLNFGIGGLSYKSDKNENGANATNTFNFTFGHMLNIGLSKNFNTGHKMHAFHLPGDETMRRSIITSGDDDDIVPSHRKRERGSDEDE
jgi:Outer membrane protein beta-barrel domain